MQSPADQALTALDNAVQAAIDELQAAWAQIQVPDHETAPAGVTPGQLAAELPRLEYGRRSRGALVVGTRLHWLSTRDTDDPANGHTFHKAVVSQNSTLVHPTGGFIWNPNVGRSGKGNYNHIEQSSAAILRKLTEAGVDISNAFVVVNKTEVCPGELADTHDWVSPPPPPVPMVAQLPPPGPPPVAEQPRRARPVEPDDIPF